MGQRIIDLAYQHPDKFALAYMPCSTTIFEDLAALPVRENYQPVVLSGLWTTSRYRWKIVWEANRRYLCSVLEGQFADMVFWLVGQDVLQTVAFDALTDDPFLVGLLHPLTEREVLDLAMYERVFREHLWYKCDRDLPDLVASFEKALGCECLNFDKFSDFLTHNTILHPILEEYAEDSERGLEIDYDLVALEAVAVPRVREMLLEMCDSRG